MLKLSTLISTRMGEVASDLDNFSVSKIQSELSRIIKDYLESDVFYEVYKVDTKIGILKLDIRNLNIEWITNKAANFDSFISSINDQISKVKLLEGQSIRLITTTIAFPTFVLNLTQSDLQNYIIKKDEILSAWDCITLGILKGLESSRLSQINTKSHGLVKLKLVINN